MYILTLNIINEILMDLRKILSTENVTTFIQFLGDFFIHFDK